MTFGQKLKEARAIAGLSQEKLAEQLNISRSAVAKWESDNGMPDITNLKSISRLLKVSIDFLLNEQGEFTSDMIQISQQEENTDEDEGNKIEILPEYIGYYCSVDLTGWNDGVSNAIILGQDNDFLYYKRSERKKSYMGMLGKKHITSITREKACQEEYHNLNIDRNYFPGKQVGLEVARKEGFIKGFFDFSNDDYQDVMIKEFAEKEVILAVGKAINIETITKIEEL